MKLKFIILIFIFVLINPLQALPAPAKWARPQCIKTYVPPKHKHTKLMKEAFEKWSKASGNKIKFYYVEIELHTFCIKNTISKNFLKFSEISKFSH